MSRPIRWTIKHVSKESVAPSQSGRVIVLDGNPSTLDFRATAVCGEESPLFLTLVAAFSASEGIRKDTGIISWVEWPGKVTIDGRTVGESSASVEERGDGKQKLAKMSFRVNLLHTNQRDSTSLYDCLGVEVDRELLLEKILESLSWMQFGWANGMHSQLLRRVRSMTETIGRNVSVRVNQGREQGKVVEVDQFGRLNVRLRDGREVTLTKADELVSL